MGVLHVTCETRTGQALNVCRYAFQVCHGRYFQNHSVDEMEVDGQELLGARNNDPPTDALAAIGDFQDETGTLIP